MSLWRKILTGWKAEYNLRHKHGQFLKGLSLAPDALTPQHPLGSSEISFLHNGHAGDIIYSIPAMYALAGGRKIRLYLHLHQPAQDFTPSMKHPNGKLMLNEKSVELLAPLLLAQAGFIGCEAWQGQPIHYDLTMYRRFPFDYRMGSIARWYFLTFGVSSDLGKPWLSVTPDPSFAKAIVIARSSRYHAPGVDYRFLQQYPELFFIGVPEEYAEMKKQLPSLQYRPVKDFAEMAAVIAGSKLFIGNQSFPFSLAEALKTKRALEVYHQVPNVIVEGANGYDFCYQPQFEKIVKDLAG
ncbi:glycosyltransferase family 9 protein [Sediminibacterium soli]|uniref:hypothetical protein n=1 Tax=Sediminibacterium soli TaxID=2698829 RepID=UPI00137A7D31|nr:hypothetical protein [Sediminibacterium soli]NCI46613.1 hypothetical protein [Sediminibacterium soli]